MNEYTPTTDEIREYIAAADRVTAHMFSPEDADAADAFDRWLAAHDAEVRAGVVAQEPEWEPGTEYGYEDFEHGLVPLVTGYESITHERPVRYGPWVPVKQEGTE